MSKRQPSILYRRRGLPGRSPPKRISCFHLCPCLHKQAINTPFEWGLNRQQIYNLTAFVTAGYGVERNPRASVCVTNLRQQSDTDGIWALRPSQSRSPYEVHRRGLRRLRRYAGTQGLGTFVLARRFRDRLRGRWQSGFEVRWGHAAFWGSGNRWAKSDA